MWFTQKMHHTDLLYTTATSRCTPVLPNWVYGFLAQPRPTHRARGYPTEKEW